MLKEIFVSEVRVKILKLFLLNLNSSFHVRAVVRSVSAEINAVRRELDRLTRINLLRKRQSSNRIYYSVNTSHVFFPELLSLFAKEEGLGAEIIKSEKRIGDIQFAVLAKAFLRGRIVAALDVDLFIVGNVKMDVLSQIIKNEELRIGHEINFSVMSPDEFLYRKRKSEHFVTTVLSQSRVMLIGDEERFSSVL